MNPVGEHPDLPPQLIAELHTYHSMALTLMRQEEEFSRFLLSLDGGWDV